MQKLTFQWVKSWNKLRAFVTQMILKKWNKKFERIAEPHWVSKNGGYGGGNGDSNSELVALQILLVTKSTMTQKSNQLEPGWRRYEL